MIGDIVSLQKAGDGERGRVGEKEGEMREDKEEIGEITVRRDEDEEVGLLQRNEVRKEEINLAQRGEAGEEEINLAQREEVGEEEIILAQRGEVGEDEVREPGPGLNQEEELAVNGVPDMTPEEMERNNQRSERVAVLWVIGIYLAFLIPFSLMVVFRFKDIDEECISRQDIPIYLFFSSYTFCLLTFGYRRLEYAFYLTKINPDPKNKNQAQLQYFLHFLLYSNLSINLTGFSFAGIYCDYQLKNSISSLLSTAGFMLLLTLCLEVIVKLIYHIYQVFLTCFQTYKTTRIFNKVIKFDMNDEDAYKLIDDINIRSKSIGHQTFIHIVKLMYFKHMTLKINGEIMRKLMDDAELGGKISCVYCCGDLVESGLVVVTKENPGRRGLAHLYCLERFLNSLYEPETAVLPLQILLKSKIDKKCADLTDMLFIDSAGN